mmetsp:Transcript_21207/g.52177  ORF Transcript_21207/g.52177 Transcript_21207/m.52177 type:complete len:469 (+) Transcript_21207:460-1866(+)
MQKHIKNEVNGLKDGIDEAHDSVKDAMTNFADMALDYSQLMVEEAKPFEEPSNWMKILSVTLSFIGNAAGLTGGILKGASSMADGLKLFGDADKFVGSGFSFIDQVKQDPKLPFNNPDGKVDETSSRDIILKNTLALEIAANALDDFWCPDWVLGDNCNMKDYADQLRGISLVISGIGARVFDEVYVGELLTTLYTDGCSKFTGTYSYNCGYPGAGGVCTDWKYNDTCAEWPVPQLTERGFEVTHIPGGVTRHRERCLDHQDEGCGMGYLEIWNTGKAGLSITPMFSNALANNEDLNRKQKGRYNLRHGVFANFGELHNDGMLDNADGENSNGKTGKDWFDLCVEHNCTEKDNGNLFETSFVTLYEACNHKGKLASVVPGKYDDKDHDYLTKKSNGFNLNKISSIKVQSGMAAKFFKSTNFGGISEVFAASDNCFHYYNDDDSDWDFDDDDRENFGDEVRSIHVYQLP